MVKGDAERDYYADLELNPSADANEVKKAFKKLGMGFGTLEEAIPHYICPCGFPTAFHGMIYFTLRSYSVATNCPDPR